MIPSVIILAGGLATRLRPITENIPKSLVEINGRPFLHYQLVLLKKYGFNNVVLSVGHLGEQIEAAFGDGSEYGISLRYVYDGNTLKGTGGAVAAALSFLTEDFIVMYGDSYLKYDYREVYDFFTSNRQNADGLMTVYENHGQFDRSNIVYENNRIKVYDKEKQMPGMNFIDWGLGILTKKAFENHQQQKFDLATVYQALLKNDRLLGYEVDVRFYEVGSFQGLEEAREILEV